MWKNSIIAFRRGLLEVISVILHLKITEIFYFKGDVVYETNQIESKRIEQNRCAMACQGCGAVFYFFLKKAVTGLPQDSIVKVRPITNFKHGLSPNNCL